MFSSHIIRGLKITFQPVDSTSSGFWRFTLLDGLTISNFRLLDEQSTFCDCFITQYYYLFVEDTGIYSFEMIVCLYFSTQKEKVENAVITAVNYLTVDTGFDRLSRTNPRFRRENAFFKANLKKRRKRVEHNRGGICLLYIRMVSKYFINK